jgi:GAF domain-containing protein
LKPLAAQAAISLQNARLYGTAAGKQRAQAIRGRARGLEERHMLAVEAAGDGHADWIVATDEFSACHDY